jgi:hypothetical protein
VCEDELNYFAKRNMLFFQIINENIIGGQAV